MPITFLPDGDRRLIVTTVEGSVTLDEVREHVETLVRQNVLGYADLIDASAATGPGLFSGDIRRLAQLIGALRRDHAVGPRAIVVASNAAYGMVRMLAILASAWVSVEVFRDRAAAERWLRDATSDARP